MPFIDPTSEKIFLEHMQKSIDLGESDEELNQFIFEYLSYRNINKTVSEWRIENYAQLRRWTYPPMTELNDAQAKLNSGITELENEGQNQLDDYVQACLDVKARFPKE